MWCVCGVCVWCLVSLLDALSGAGDYCCNKHSILVKLLIISALA